jgi:hypothetical protein
MDQGTGRLMGGTNCPYCRASLLGEQIPVNIEGYFTSSVSTQLGRGRRGGRALFYRLELDVHQPVDESVADFLPSTADSWLAFQICPNCRMGWSPYRHGTGLHSASESLVAANNKLIAAEAEMLLRVAAVRLNRKWPATGCRVTLARPAEPLGPWLLEFHGQDGAFCTAPAPRTVGVITYTAAIQALSAWVDE